MKLKTKRQISTSIFVLFSYWLCSLIVSTSNVLTAENQSQPTIINSENVEATSLIYEAQMLALFATGTVTQILKTRPNLKGDSFFVFLKNCPYQDSELPRDNALIGSTLRIATEEANRRYENIRFTLNLKYGMDAQGWSYANFPQCYN